ncbi:hypothetical protein BN946_scf184570.g3 [Trametes cinnabarina]|uniref:Protein kinase domain-containing protein n=1 Tax=Pycnoporus cinnabarinus TaxID=5643 RepID=A0A060SQ58_PYCCI|nr:hypothetical protein BN946_scf184570.g3 [Trametes cinnabarina]
MFGRSRPVLPTNLEEFRRARNRRDPGASQTASSPVEFESLIIDVTEHISLNEDRSRSVYRASTVVVGLGQSQEEAGSLRPFDVVLKVGYHKAQHRYIKREAEIYEKYFCTPEIKGQHVPNYLGLFLGDTYEGITTVLVLQDSAFPLNYPLEHYSLDFRLDVINALAAVHKAGVTLPDFYEGNVVVKKWPGQTHYVPMIVDFACACPHTCELELKEDEDVVPEPYIPEPSTDVFPCSDMGDACKRAQLWLPRGYWFGTTVPLHDAIDPDKLLTHPCPEPSLRGNRGLRGRAIAEANRLREWLRNRRKWDAEPPAPLDFDD